MNRRQFIAALVSLPVIAALPNPAKAAEELLDDIIYISRSWLNAEGVGFCESWRKMDGRIWRMVSSEDKVISVEEMEFCPFIVYTPYRPISSLTAP